jgi:IclR family pca regulon transcriptional regulator
VLLSYLPPGEVERYLSTVEPERITAHTIVHRERLALEIARAREQGYSVVDQELELGLRAIAVPLRNFRGDIVAAMNVSVHEGRMPLDALVERCLPAMVKIQVELSALL